MKKLITIKILCLVGMAIYAVPPVECFADLPEAPVILDQGVAGCVPREEICGDDIDQDCNGGDRACPGDDKDFDGYAAAQDCDDNNRKVYPGISVACSAACGAGTKTCQTGGSFTSCSCTPLCEAKGSGRCFYISALTGSDSNPGTFASPWKTYRNIVTYYSGSDAPATWQQLRAGDVVYFMSGIYTHTYSYASYRYALYFRGLNGASAAPIVLKAYPGAHPVIAPAQQAPGIEIMQSSYFLVEGFEVTRAYQRGISFSEGSNHELRNVWVHDNDGVDDNNMDGVVIHSIENFKMHHSLIHDNYDRTCAGTGGYKTTNSRNVGLFRGGNIRLHHNVIFQTPPITADKSGGCILFKHSASLQGGTFEVDRNTFWNCAFFSVGSASFGSRVHHNRIYDSDAVGFADYGGTAYMQDNIVEYNTMVRSSGLSYRPTDAYGPIGELTFRRNIVVDDVSSYNNENGILTLHTYGSDALYDQTVTSSRLHVGPNCYYNPAAAVRFAIFAANGGAYGVKGGLWDLPTWQSKGFDSQSVATNPQLNQDLQPQTSSCQSMGLYAQ